MSRFDFLTQHSVDMNEVDKMGKREFYLDHVLAQRSINIFYAPAATGKTWLAFALCKALIACNQDVIYLDNDNGVDLLKDRGFDRFIEAHKGHMHYVNADMMDDPKEEMARVLAVLRDRATGNFYNKSVLVFDSLQFFMGGGMYDEAKMDRFFAMCKAIRRSGGMVIVLNHSLKSGIGMKGGGTLINSADEIWCVRKVSGDDKEIHFILTPEKQRIGTEEAGYSINTKTLTMRPLDPVVASMSSEEREFVTQVQELLKDNLLKQGDLLTAIGTHKADKTKLGWLDKHDQRYWKITKKGKTKQYEKYPTTNETLQLPSATA